MKNSIKKTELYFSIRPYEASITDNSIRKVFYSLIEDNKLIEARFIINELLNKYPTDLNLKEILSLLNLKINEK